MGMPQPDDSSPELDAGATLRRFAAKQRLFGRYELREILGRGGMGVVWRAYDEQLERDVALKFLPELLVLDRAAMMDLKRETKRSLELTHHHIVRIYDFAQDDQSACISMEYVDGATLSASRIERPNQVFEVEDLGSIVEQACDALEYAHGKARIVHRDFKPSNLMRNSRGELKVTDFGISRSLTDSVSMLSMRTSGTLVYMSPQQLDGERADPMDDIYSLGATLYELLTGKPPFYSGGIERQIRDKTPETMSARRAAFELAQAKMIPEQWEVTIAACLAKDPRQRPRSAADVAKRLGLAVPRSERVVFPTQPPTATATPITTPTSREPLPETAVQLPPPPPKRNFAVPAMALLLVVLAGGLLVWYSGFFLPGNAARKMEDARTADAEAKRKAAEQSARARGALLVNTEPAGATVTLGTQSRKSPTSFGDLPIGTARLRVFLDGYETVERDVEVRENQISDPGVIRLVRIAALPSPSVPDVSAARTSERPSVTPAPPVAEVITTPSTTPPLEQEILGQFTYRGMVGPYEAIFHLNFETGERVSGHYNLPKSINKDLVLRLEGRNPSGKLYLNEYTGERLSAYIELTLRRSSTEIRWEGTMYNTPPDNRVFPVSFARSR